MQIVTPAALTSLTADRTSPIPAGAATTFTATATPGSLPPEYQFERRDGTDWLIVQPWSASHQYSWTPLATDAGDHDLRVLVRGAGSSDPYDDSRTMAFTVASSGAARTLEDAPVALLIDSPVLGTDTVRHSIYGSGLELLAEQERTGTTAGPGYEYIWLNGQPLAQVTTSTGAIDYYFNDHLGTPLLQTGSTGTVVWRAEHEPYGNVRTLRAGAGKHQPLRFPGAGGEWAGRHVVQRVPVVPGGVGAVYAGGPYRACRRRELVQVRRIQSSDVRRSIRLAGVQVRAPDLRASAAATRRVNDVESDGSMVAPSRVHSNHKRRLRWAWWHCVGV